MKTVWEAVIPYSNVVIDVTGCSCSILILPVLFDDRMKKSNVSPPLTISTNFKVVLLLVTIVLIATTAFTYYYYNTSKTHILLVHASRDTAILLTTPNHTVVHIAIEIKGYTHDTFRINSHTRIPGGNIDTTLDYDFYKRNYTFTYEALKATAGNLRVKVRF